MAESMCASSGEHMIGSGVDTDRLAALLEDVARRLGIEIRYDRFERDALGITARGGARGGLCRIRGRHVVLMEEGLRAPDRVAILARALAYFDLESIYVAPIVRATIRAHADGAPARLRPLAKVGRRKLVLIR